MLFHLLPISFKLEIQNTYHDIRVGPCPGPLLWFENGSSISQINDTRKTQFLQDSWKKSIILELYDGFCEINGYTYHYLKVRCWRKDFTSKICKKFE